MTSFSTTPRGPFSLAASARFLEGFTPAAHPGSRDGVLRLAFPADDGRETAGVAVAQDADGTVRAEITAADGASAAQQVWRFLSLDVDGAGFAEAVAGDPVVTEVSRRHPGLRPVCFCSPYEAAAWSVIGHRVRMEQAARLKAAMAERLGETVNVAGEELAAFPDPETLREAPRFPGLTESKTVRLRGVAEAALRGDLDADRLRDMPIDAALKHLRRLDGIGPFYAELILLRGAGHPDVFPRNEPRLHSTMAELYGLSDPGVERLADIAQGWSPFRGWVSVLLRTHRHETAER